MEATLHALGGILLRALPTFILVLLLNAYLKWVFFKPMGRVLDARHAATAGARQAAEESLQHAEAKAAEYVTAVRAARGEAYQAQEKLHRQLRQEREVEMRAARERADAAVRAARAGIQGEAREAKAALEARSEVLAEEIAGAVLRGRAA